MESLAEPCFHGCMAVKLPEARRLIFKFKSRYLKATGGKQNTFLQFELSVGISGVNSTLLMFFCQ